MKSNAEARADVMIAAGLGSLRACSTTVSAPAFQAGDTGSIPVRRSKLRPFKREPLAPGLVAPCIGSFMRLRRW